MGFLVLALGGWLLLSSPPTHPPPSLEESEHKDGKNRGPGVTAASQGTPKPLAQPTLRSPSVNEDRAGAIHGSVRNAAILPEHTVWVQATCGRRTLVDTEGDFFLYGNAGECTLQAMRRHGALTIWGDLVTIQVVQDGEHEVQLSIPDWKPAGLGISLREDEYGIRIGRVFPGSPAEKYGLKTGDVILEIDGVATADLSTHEFIEFGVGPEGTEVELLVATDDDEHAITLTRGLVESPNRHPSHEVTGNVLVDELPDGSLEVIRIPDGLSEEEMDEFLEDHPIRRTIPAPSDE